LWREEEDLKLERRDATTVVIPRTGAMRVEGVIFADGRLMEDIKDDPCLDQVANVACMPGIVRASYAMPDIHWGYGFPIGGVAAFDLDEGVVSPGGVGYDINCGVRVLSTRLSGKDVSGRVEELVMGLFSAVPSGVGSHHKSFELSREQMRKACEQGASWAVSNGYGRKEDLAHIEEGGCIPGGDFDAVSNRAYERGKNQLGTLGSGNHFVEIQVVDEVFLPDVAAMLGLTEGSIAVSIHTGSRGLGYQVCAETIDALQPALARHGISLPDRQLVCAPIRSPEGKRYLAAMAAAANYAFANRQMITHFVRGAFEQVLGMSEGELGVRLVYDVCHNIAKIESHEVDGSERKVCVHRKGATRCLPAGHPLVPPAYREIGQPVLIPGDMGRASYVLVGAPGAVEKCWGSSAHGAGRVLGRKQALKATQGRRVQDELRQRGVFARAASFTTLREEFPEAYKDVSDVVRVVEKAGLGRRVVRLRPVGVIKG